MNKLSLLVIVLCAFLLSARSQEISFRDRYFTRRVESPDVTFSREKDRLNFFVIAKRKKGKLDLATRYNILRTRLRELSHQHTFVSIVAQDAADMSAKVRECLEKGNAKIGTIWFDSHGSYKKGYSLFYIGKDECNSHSLTEPGIRTHLELLKGYIDDESKIIIGSCYGGATYKRKSVDYRETMQMDGNTLMIALGEIFNHGQVFASESWVMSKPGLFRRKAAVGGHPGRKLFYDSCYQPAWEMIGIWNQYNAATDEFQRSNPVALDKSGNLVVRGESFEKEKNISGTIRKKLKKLKPGVFK